MKRRLVVVAYSQPYARIVRFKNGRANLLKTLSGMGKGQTILMRMAPKDDRIRIQGAANNAGVRIKIEEHPALNTIRVTSLGPQRERVMSEEASSPQRVRYFKPRSFPPTRSAPKVTKATVKAVVKTAAKTIFD